MPSTDSVESFLLTHWISRIRIAIAWVKLRGHCSSTGTTSSMRNLRTTKASRQPQQSVHPFKDAIGSRSNYWFSLRYAPAIHTSPCAIVAYYSQVRTIAAAVKHNASPMRTSTKYNVLHTVRPSGVRGMSE
jgi:hypothetical protein